MQLDIVTTATPDAWTSALERAGWHDFYHEAWYHALAEERGEGRAELLVASHGACTIALPLLFRPVDRALGAGHDRLQDATSVYGYGGPAGLDVDAGIARRFVATIEEYLRACDTVSVFSRLHPLFDQGALLQGAGRIVHAGATVSIDLRREPAQQWSDYRADNRNRISRMRREGFTCERRPAADLDVFVSIYEATMQRLSARAYYSFPREHYEALVDPARGDLELWVVADKDGTPAAAGLFSLRCGLVQYHLSGAVDAYRKLAPTVLLLDTVRCSAIERGATRFHLGGGLGGAEDSLFHFKSGFGTGRHAFHVWSWVLDPAVYGDLEAHRLRRAPPPPASFFPVYRAP